MDSEEEASREDSQSISNSRTDAGDTQSISVSSGVRSTSVVDSQDTSGIRGEMDEHRNMMFASLLEDYFRTRATEFLNATSPGKNYTRQSQEVQPLARQLFTEASRKLSSNGMLSDFAASDTIRSSRRQYLSALDNLVADSQPSASIRNPMRDLILQTSQLALIPHPANDLQLTIQSPPRSHYQSSFQEVALLGKGGFGKVYQCFNPLDRGTYAVKKIHLPPKLGKRFRDGNLEEFQHILREVQALATLDHPNIVRYYATWFEEPHQPPVDSNAHESSKASHRRQLLLPRSHSFSQFSEDILEPSLSGGVVFEEDTQSVPDCDNDNQLVEGRQWFEESISSHGVLKVRLCQTLAMMSSQTVRVIREISVKSTRSLTGLVTPYTYRCHSIL